MTENDPNANDPILPAHAATEARSGLPTTDALRLVLVGAWRHSHEEDHHGTHVFRKKDYPFPPSRGRLAFQLLADGLADFQPIGRDDRSPNVPCHWMLAGSPIPDLILSNASQDSQAVFQGRIVHASPQRLEIEFHV